jgi:hypothetical protein
MISNDVNLTSCWRQFGVGPGGAATVGKYLAQYHFPHFLIFGRTINLLQSEI